MALLFLRFRSAELEEGHSTQRIAAKIDATVFANRIKTLKTLKTLCMKSHEHEKISS